MSGFDTRPKGTVMHGAFGDFTTAERALRVLRNAGYLRCAVEPVRGETGGGPAVVTVDAAAPGAARAAEILRQYGAELRYAADSAAPVELAAAPLAAERAPEPAPLSSAEPAPLSPAGPAPLSSAEPAPLSPVEAAPLSSGEPKPRSRKRSRPKARLPGIAPSAAGEFTIKTRGADVMPLGESLTAPEAVPEET